MAGNKSIVIRISNSGVFLNPDLELPISATNIPAESLSFKDSKNIFFEALMVSFQKDKGMLELKVVDYYSENFEQFVAQSPKYEVKSLFFQPFHWKEIQIHLSSFQKKRLAKIITQDKFVGPINDKAFSFKFRIPISKLKFEMGFISFIKKFKWNNQSDEFRIINPNVIPEYDYIKGYFQKIVGKKTIDVQLEVRSTATKTVVSNIKSDDLLAINGDSVQVLKTQKLKEWTTKKPKIEIKGRALFDFEEVIDLYGDSAFGNIDLFEKELLFNVLGDESIRNRAQLGFLSKEVQNPRNKLLLSIFPQFGFVFYTKSSEMHHFIWELLDSHATYIWSMPHTPFREASQNIENEISSINQIGRSQYKAHFQNRPDLFFNTVIHKKANSSYEDYFPRWRHIVESLLV